MLKLLVFLFIYPGVLHMVETRLSGWGWEERKPRHESRQLEGVLVGGMGGQCTVRGALAGGQFQQEARQDVTVGVGADSG